MSLGHNAKIVTDGLVFYYDMKNTKKSWKGKPTTNYAYQQNARIDNNYENYSSGDATWDANHPKAIRVYNDNNTEITGYINRGVNSGNWQVTRHAHWQFDSELNRPVVVMEDFDAQWKAKSWNTGKTMTGMGLSYGDTYTISWLQWTDNIAKSVNAGLYGLNTSGVNYFNDGRTQEKSQTTAFNTKPYTWQRLYVTFTVSTTWNLASTISCYMYGHYNTRNTIKIADVQIETGYVSGFSKKETRTNTESILDMTGNNTITANSLTYNSDGSFEFNGTSGFLGTGVIPADFGMYDSEYTAIGMINVSDVEGDNMIFGTPTALSREGLHLGIRSNYFYFGHYGADSNTSGTKLVEIDTWYHVAFVYDGTTQYIYVNGNLEKSTNALSFLGTTEVRIARGVSSYTVGNIPIAQIYNRALTDQEVKQNFNALRGRYGL